MTSNLTSVTLEMRLRSNLPIYAGRAWSYCGGLVIIGIRRGLNNKGQLFSCFGHCAMVPWWHPWILRIFKKYIMGLFLVSSCLGVPILVQIGTAQSELLQNNSSQPKRVKKAKILKSCKISYNRKIEIAKRCKKIESKFKKIWTQYKK